ncbi:hypothetical protein AMELA_G00196020 [Ameiurus melas]|uniref:LEM domain-containing protein n=1 Tax=Ameiurus melas TaxID=219545 RepID=A0A7J6A5N3_AMEME|nr:hypothetical protein AMELA_G00196020 [Ameiurus melas]
MAFALVTQMNKHTHTMGYFVLMCYTALFTIIIKLERIRDALFSAAQSVLKAHGNNSGGSLVVKSLTNPSSGPFVSLLYIAHIKMSNFTHTKPNIKPRGGERHNTCTLFKIKWQSVNYFQSSMPGRLTFPAHSRIYTPVSSCKARGSRPAREYFARKVSISSWNAPTVTAMSSLSSKSSDELCKLLDEYGINHGPIVDSTRKLYEKKLAEAMAKNPKPSSDKTFYREEQEEITYVTYHPPLQVQHENFGDVTRRTRTTENADDMDFANEIHSSRKKRHLQ